MVFGDDFFVTDSPDFYDWDIKGFGDKPFSVKRTSTPKLVLRERARKAWKSINRKPTKRVPLKQIMKMSPADRANYIKTLPKSHQGNFQRAITRAKQKEEMRRNVVAMQQRQRALRRKKVRDANKGKLENRLKHIDQAINKIRSRIKSVESNKQYLNKGGKFTQGRKVRYERQKKNLYDRMSRLIAAKTKLQQAMKAKNLSGYQGLAYLAEGVSPLYQSHVDTLSPTYYSPSFKNIYSNATQLENEL